MEAFGLSEALSSIGVLNIGTSFLPGVDRFLVYLARFSGVLSLGVSILVKIAGG